MSAPTSQRARLSRGFVALGLFLLLLALACDPSVVARWHLRQPLSTEALEETARSRWIFAAAGILACALAAWVRRSARFERPWTVRLTLTLTSVTVPLLLLERGTRPFVERLTRLYVADEELGWRHRSGIQDTYWGEPAQINSFGLRGAERGLSKPSGTRRVLALGDSVVFGLTLREEQTIPARLEAALTESGTPVEVWNAAVCGWAPWQHLRWLEREGERLGLDAVLLGFTLNDVTEPMTLERFGGSERGAQLQSAREREGWLGESGLYLALREDHVRRALAGDSAAAKARAERLTPYHLMLEPESPRVQAAWPRVLSDLESIQDWCRARALPLLLVVFPYAVQVDGRAGDAPQRVLAELAERRSLACLDLLPPLQAARGSAREPLFFDGLHPTARGADLMAGEIREALDRLLAE